MTKSQMSLRCYFKDVLIEIKYFKYPLNVKDFSAINFVTSRRVDQVTLNLMYAPLFFNYLEA